MERIKENISMTINQNKSNHIIKLDNTDDLDDNPLDNPCGESEMEVIQPKIKKIINKSICNKCKINKSKYLNRSEYVCRECFLYSVDHKFRSNLRTNCKIRHEDYVLVCISGGVNSMAMLEWFNLTFNDNKSNKKLFFKLKVMYVDDTCLELLNGDCDLEKIMSERQNRISTLKGICEKAKFSFDYMTLESSVSIPSLNDASITESGIEEEPKEYNEALINQFLSAYEQINKTASFNTDFVKIMTQNLIFYYALKHKFTKIVFGNSAQSLVNSMFHSVIKGRGFTVREDIGYIDTHYLQGRVTILRPLRDFLEKEILLFNHINNVELIYSSHHKIENEKPVKQNLPFGGNTVNLLHSFFSKQQERSSSIITTVLGTADKLKLKNKNTIQLTCEFCVNYIDDIYNELEIGSIDTMNNE